MAIAAVPRYLGEDFSAAAPGHRFGMYLKLWGVESRTRESLWTTHDLNYRTAGPQREERSFKDENKTEALKGALKLNEVDKRSMKALSDRQSAAAAFLESSGQLLRLEAKSIAPFSTGLGNEHPLENGFAFLNPYGLPYLAGSGVKGVLRQAARELASGDWGGTQGWDDRCITVLFGTAPETEPLIRGALSFWDVIPQLAGDSLKVEVMTPHQTHYYDAKKGESPHESGSPNPINFLAVPPGSGFAFHVQCDRPFLARIAPDLVEGNRWQTLIRVALEHAFEWLGFGAKTAVGYGAMREDPEAIERRRKAAADTAQREAAEAAVREREAAEQQRRTTEDARKAAEREAFDALSDNQKALHLAREKLDAAARVPEISRAAETHVLQAAIKPIAEGATGWPSPVEREAAARLLEQSYDLIGWFVKGVDKDKRKKQEAKKRELIAAIRKGPSGP